VQVRYVFMYFDAVQNATRLCAFCHKRDITGVLAGKGKSAALSTRLAVNTRLALEEYSHESGTDACSVFFFKSCYPAEIL
jgi:hypothetical protein